MRGDLGWAYDQTYRFDFNYMFDQLNPTATRLQMTVCNAAASGPLTTSGQAYSTSACFQEFDLGLGSAVYGNLGFYTLSQSEVTYRLNYDDFADYQTLAGSAFAASVPLPASLWLLMTALGSGVLCGLRRKRAVT